TLIRSFLPFGDHVGPPLILVRVPPLSNSTRVLPVERRTRSRKRSCSTNRIDVPDGDHAGSNSHSFVCVTRFSPVPSAFMVNRSLTPCCALKNTISEPSGDQAGSRSLYLPFVS